MRTAMVYAGTFLCLCPILVPVAPGAGSALALICLGALALNALAANLVGLITDLFPESVLARVSGLTGVGDGVMSMCGMFLTGVVVDRFSYTPVFVAAGLLPVLSLAAYFLLVLARPRRARQSRLPEKPHSSGLLNPSSQNRREIDPPANVLV